MKTDKELLELAAKAACYDVVYEEFYLTFFHKDCKGRVRWNPLTDDGDALRLAVKLKLDFYVTEKEAGCWIDDFVCLVEDVGTDQYAATRRAIVRAAAAIGEKL